MTKDELAQLSETALKNYFEKHARYHNRPHRRGGAYSIRLGNVALTSDDTMDLWNEFRKAVHDQQKVTV